MYGTIDPVNIARGCIDMATATAKRAQRNRAIWMRSSLLQIEVGGDLADYTDFILR